MDIQQAIQDKITNKATDIAKGILRVGVLPYGLQLKRDLGIDQFKNVWIYKLLAIPFNVYVVVLDSRFPNRYIPIFKVRKTESLILKRLVNFRDIYKMKAYKISQPMQVEDYNQRIPTNSLIIMHDLAGEYVNDLKMFEKTFKDGTKVMIG